jgi:hypothetical protein
MVIVISVQRVTPKEFVDVNILALQSKIRGLAVHRADSGLVGGGVRTLVTMCAEPHPFIDGVTVT